MGEVKKRQAVKLIIGFIFKEEKSLETAENLLKQNFGKIDFESSVLPFEHTDYYESEFGKALKRKFISFEKLFPAQNLPKIKVLTNAVEKKLAIDSRRTINIDPGYLDLSKLVLASTKDYKHRIYLDQGIYAEITLFYQDKSFQVWEWTFPDYRTKDYIAIFNQIRAIYSRQIR
jgi:hypothetical protein